MADLSLNPFRTGTLLGSLSDSSRASLGKLAKASCTDSDFLSFSKASVDCLTNPAKGPSADLAAKVLTGLAGREEQAAAWEAYKALLLDFIKCNTPGSAVVAALEDVGVSGSRAKAVAEYLASKAAAVREELIAGGELLLERSAGPGKDSVWGDARREEQSSALVSVELTCAMSRGRRRRGASDQQQDIHARTPGCLPACLLPPSPPLQAKRCPSLLA